MQEVRELVEKAKAAQNELCTKNQKEVDAIVKSIAYAGVRNAKAPGQDGPRRNGIRRGS